MKNVYKRLTLIEKLPFIVFLLVSFYKFRHLKLDLPGGFFFHFRDPLIALLPVLMVSK